MSPAECRAATPILRVDDLEASLGPYVRVLGFTMDSETMTAMRLLSSPQDAIFLSVGDQPGAGCGSCARRRAAS
jgi:hypothetical protein